MRHVTRLGFATLTALLVAGCGGGSSALRPADQRLAARVAPTAADLGPTMRLVGSFKRSQLRTACPAPVTGCAIRAFELRRNNAAGVLAFVEVFATASAANSDYEQATRRYSATETRPAVDTTMQLSLQAKEDLAIGHGHATLLLRRWKPDRVSQHNTVIQEPKYVRTILIREGRAVVILSPQPAGLLRFAATAQTLATRMRPALQASDN